jgi:hypothetical protein
VPPLNKNNALASRRLVAATWLDAYRGRRNFLKNACVSLPCGVLLSPFRDRAPARIPAVTKPIDAATIMSMTMIAADHMLISAMTDGAFIFCD